MMLQTLQILYQQVMLIYKLVTELELQTRLAGFC